MKKLPLLLCILFLPILASCDYIFPSTWNYRITVEIETPEGIKSGSTVRQVVVAGSWTFNPDVSRVHREVSGEAVVVDLEEQGVLFALIDSNSYKEVYNAFPQNTRNLSEEVEYYQNIKVGTKAVLRNDYPRLVRFENLNDPKSVRLVYIKKQYANGLQIADHFEKYFGAGVKLKQITIEITDEPVTWDVVDKYLPRTYLTTIIDGWRELSFDDRKSLSGLIGFKRGEK